MIHIGLFEGIGGFSFAAKLAGWETLATCEINPFGQHILKHYWPGAYHHGDIKTLTYDTINAELSSRYGTDWRKEPVIITGGFPCQPYSLAGKRLGKEDDRHLWPEMLRVIREISPEWVVGENVFGLVNWDGGLVFDEVQSDLEAAGYEVQPFILPACGVNAPHKRERVWFVAHSTRNGSNRTSNGASEPAKRQDGNTIKQSEKCSEIRSFANANHHGPHGSQDRQGNSQGHDNSAPRTDTAFKPPRCGGEAVDSNANHKGLEGGERRCPHGEWNGEEAPGSVAECAKIPAWDQWPTQSPVRERNDGISNRMVRYLTKELQDEISNTSKENRIENLQEVWQRVSKEEIWEKIRGFYSLESKDLLLQTMQLYAGGHNSQSELSPFSENFSKDILQYLQKHGEFRSSPQGQELEKQRVKQFGDSLSFLPHEVALAARRFETAIAKFENWHRTESLKAYGNAIVPQVVYQIFKAINQMQ